jgi:hypothetical protein
VYKQLCLPLALALASCSTPKPAHPGLTPLAAEQLLHFDTRAQNRLKYIKSRNPICDFKVVLPDQSAHPDTITVEHVVNCGGRTDLKEFDSSVEFQWNKTTNEWELSYFGSR